MRLTSADVARFVGGQMEIQNQGEEYLYRGEIATISVDENNVLQAKFAWLAKGEGYPTLTTKWIKDDHLDYAASLEIYSARDIGPGEPGGDNRIALHSSIVGETVALFPPNGSKLDRAEVEGLEPLTA